MSGFQVMSPGHHFDDVVFREVCVDPVTTRHQDARDNPKCAAVDAWRVRVISGLPERIFVPTAERSSPTVLARRGDPLDPLDDRAGGQRTARAHRDQRGALVGALEFVQRGGDELAAGGTDPDGPTRSRRR
jgi:hypothetical protein